MFFNNLGLSSCVSYAISQTLAGPDKQIPHQVRDDSLD